MRSVLPLVAVVVVGACAHEGDEPMLVLGNTAQMQGSVTCTYTGATDQPITSSGVISVDSPGGYIASPLIQSRITAEMGQELDKTIELQGAIVQLSVPAGSQAITLASNEALFQALFSATVGPLGTVNVSFELVPASVIKSVAALGNTSSVEVEVVATVTPFGLLGGDRVTGEPWQYPVTICNDCVVFDDGPCPVKITTIRVGDPCNIFQDGAVDCCETTVNGATGLTCPATTM